MIICMKETRKFSPDGMKEEIAEKGKSVEVPDNIATAWIEQEIAEVPGEKEEMSLFEEESGDKKRKGRKPNK